jgi:prepilin-type N-terminal cleavage/methylation domain-containing protein
VQVKAGFTLMELMVAVACASVLALAVIGSYSAYRDVFARCVESYGRESVELLHELHEATKNVRLGGRHENRF